MGRTNRLPLLVQINQNNARASTQNGLLRPALPARSRRSMGRQHQCQGQQNGQI